MNDRQYGIVIVEDDFRIADIHKAFIEQSDGFCVLGVARNAAEARALIATCAEAVDLVLLDAYLPDVEGLELLWAIRQRHTRVDIVMITAAREMDTIAEALRGGVFDYLIKPVEAARMTQMLSRFRRERGALAQQGEMSQEELDRVLARQQPDPIAPMTGSSGLPKGIDRLTLDRVIDVLTEKNAAQTAMQVARSLGASRSTARRYLEFMVAEKRVDAELGYGDVGRPERRYRLIEPR
ncbi:response regulator [Halomonas sp. HNIBRBA4712]|uniref:response regulator n=1 Tax=Halomonas sp. HNIBRBA4712 TaxID=3373087 RepID=UPI003744C9A6